MQRFIFSQAGWEQPLHPQLQVRRLLRRAEPEQLRAAAQQQLVQHGKVPGEGAPAIRREGNTQGLQLRPLLVAEDAGGGRILRQHALIAARQQQRPGRMEPQIADAAADDAIQRSRDAGHMVLLQQHLQQLGKLGRLDRRRSQEAVHLLQSADEDLMQLGRLLGRLELARVILGLGLLLQLAVQPNLF